MAKSKKLNDLYIRFLNQKQSVETSGGNDLLDDIEERLLQMVAQAHLSNADLSVTDLMQRTEIASPATLHKRLQSLREAELISIEPVPNAYPRKSVTLTPKAISYYNRLASEMKKASRAAA